MISRMFAIVAALAGMSAPLVVGAQDRPAPAAPSSAPAPSAKLSVEDERLVQRAIDRGQLMYAYDRAAWVGTDDMRAKLPDYAGKVGGWIVDGPVHAPHLVFYSRDKDHPTAVYVADFHEGKLTSSKVIGPGDDATITPGQLRMIEARTAAIAAATAGKALFCAKASPNSIVLPPDTPGGHYLVYLLTPQTSNDAVPAGGHYLFEIADGKAVDGRAFTKGCLALTMRGKNGEKPAALVVSHLLDPVPTEIHVFTMFAARLPVVVLTSQNKRMWSIESQRGNARITLIPNPPK